MDKLKELSKFDMLVIRACKSLEPHKRLTTLYRRFYIKNIPENYDVYSPLTLILINLCENHCPISLRDLIDGLHPNSIFTYRPDSQKRDRKFQIKLQSKSLRINV